MPSSKLVALLLFHDGAGHAAEEGRQAGGHDDRRGGAALDARAQVADVGQFQGRSARSLFPGGEFLDGERLPGQAALDEEQVFAGKQPHVGGDHVPGGEFHHVAGNQVADRHFLRLAVAEDGRVDADHRPEFGGGGIGPGLLNEAQNDAEDHHEQA